MINFCLRSIKPDSAPSAISIVFDADQLGSCEAIDNENNCSSLFQGWEERKVPSPGSAAVRPAESGYELVVIAASRGGLRALGTILSTLPQSFPIPIAIVQHRSSRLPNRQADVLGRYTGLQVKIAAQHELLRPGVVYLAPPDLHLTIDADRRLHLVDGVKIRHLRSSANPLFSSAAHVFGAGVLAVVLTGGDRDGTDGVQTVKQNGGTVIAQDERTSEDFSMPRSAIATGCVDRILPIEEIGPTLQQLVKTSKATDALHV